MLLVALLIVSENLYYLEKSVLKWLIKMRKGNNRYKCHLYSSVSATLLNHVEKQNLIKTDTLMKLFTGLIKFFFSSTQESNRDT